MLFLLKFPYYPYYPCLGSCAGIIFLNFESGAATWIRGWTSKPVVPSSGNRKGFALPITCF